MIALSRANCKAENAVMIGDRIDNDIVPANIMGFKTIWIKQGFGKYWHIQELKILSFRTIAHDVKW